MQYDRSWGSARIRSQTFVLVWTDLSWDESNTLRLEDTLTRCCNYKQKGFEVEFYDGAQSLSHKLRQGMKVWDKDEAADRRCAHFVPFPKQNLWSIATILLWHTCIQDWVINESLSSSGSDELSVLTESPWRLRQISSNNNIALNIERAHASPERLTWTKSRNSSSPCSRTVACLAMFKIAKIRPPSTSLSVVGKPWLPSWTMVESYFEVRLEEFWAMIRRPDVGSLRSQPFSVLEVVFCCRRAYRETPKGCDGWPKCIEEAC